MASDRRICKAVLLAAALLGAVLIPVRSPGAERLSIEELLKAEQRWTIIHGLESWSEKLSADQVELLEEFTRKNKNLDWELNYHVQQLLRRNLPDKYRVSREVERAEVLFIAATVGKVEHGTYDKYIDQIAQQGSAVIPLLLELLDCCEYHDFFRKDLAIKVLSRLDDPRIMPVLKSQISAEKQRNHLEQELLTVLQHDPGDEMVDYVAAAIARQNSSFDQEYIITFLSRQPLPYRAKMRLYSHYEKFQEYGRHAVIRGLARIDDEAAFARLAAMLREKTSPYSADFRITASVVGDLKNCDPCPVLLEALKEAPDSSCTELIVPLAQRNYLPAVPVFEDRIARAREDASGTRCRVWAAGALCKLGKDFRSNAEIVKEHLRSDYDPHGAGYAAYGAAGWLKDKEIIEILTSKLSESEPNKETLGWTIEALGQIADVSALPALRESLTRLPCEKFQDVGQAIEQIGRKNNDRTMTDEGQTVQLVAQYLQNLGGQQSAWQPDSREAESMNRRREQVVDWLKRNSRVAPNIIAQSRSAWNRELIEQLVQTAQ